MLPACLRTMSHDSPQRLAQAQDEDEGVRTVAVTRYDGARSGPEADDVVCEEPLEIQIGGAPLAVVMRTPGHDEELALGLLLNEGIVASASDVVAIRHCSVAESPEAEGNVLRVTLRPGIVLDLRIRQEGWEVELFLRAQRERLMRHAA